MQTTSPLTVSNSIVKTACTGRVFEQDDFSSTKPKSANMPKQILTTVCLPLVIGLFLNSLYPLNADSAELADEFFSDVPDSAWIDTQRRNYRELIGQIGFDVIVVPFQTRGDSLDRIGRSLLARQIAARIERSSDLRVADPGLVERALGEGFRRVTESDISALALISNAKIVVTGYVEHDRHNHMQTTVEIWRFRLSSPWKEFDREIISSDEMEFSDLQLPYAVFSTTANRVSQAVTGNSSSVRIKKYRGIADAPVPESFSELKERASESPLFESLYLEFLSSLTPGDFPSHQREHLAERALVDLETVSPSTPGYSYLKARALGGLYRRPAAIAMLRRPKGNAEKALLAILNSDLPRAENITKKIKPGILRLMAELDLQGLKTGYNWPLDSGRGMELAQQYPAWEGLYYRAFSSGDRWARHSNAWVKAILDEHVPAPGLTGEEFVRGTLAKTDFPDEYDFATASLTHYDNVLQRTARHWLSARPSSTAPWEGDILEISATTLVFNTLATIISDRVTRGAPGSALATAQQYGALYEGHPVFTLETAQAQIAAGRRLPNDRRTAANLSRKARELSRKGFVWAGGLNAYTAFIARYRIAAFPEVLELPRAERERLMYLSDFPPRPMLWWQGESEQDIAATQLECLRYVVLSFTCLKRYYTYLISESAGHKPDMKAASKLLDDNKHRFIDLPGKLKFFGDLLRREGDFDAERKLYRKAIADNTLDWDAYQHIGNDLTAQGEYDAASKTYLKYPGFTRTDIADSVTLAAHAYYGGSILYWTGAYAAAKPLYELAASYQTGSDASLSAEIRLKLLDGNLPEATRISLRRAQRYNSHYAYRDYIALMHIQGQHEPAWALFNILAKNPKLNRPEIWTGALVGHKLSGTDAGDIATWLRKSKLLDSIDGQTGTKLAPRYVFLAGVVDRLPDDELAGLVTEVDPGPPVIRQTDGRVLRGRQIIHPHPGFGTPEITVTDEPETLAPRLSYMARGLSALYRHSYDEAFKQFNDASQIYRLDEFIPYYAWASARTGKLERISGYLDNMKTLNDKLERTAPWQKGRRFFEHLSRAYIHGAAGKHQLALEHLNHAINDRPFTAEKSMPTFYQTIETAELLYDFSGYEGYRLFAINHARNYQRMQPMYSWAYAVVGKYTTDLKEKIRNIATAMHLDPASYRVSTIPPDIREQAGSWLTRHGPVYLITGLNEGGTEL